MKNSTQCLAQSRPSILVASPSGWLTVKAVAFEGKGQWLKSWLCHPLSIWGKNLPGFYQIHTWVRRSQAPVVVEFHSTLSRKEYQLWLHYPIEDGAWHDVESYSAYLNVVPKTQVIARKACFPMSSMLGSTHESSNKVIQRLCKPNCSR